MCLSSSKSKTSPALSVVLAVCTELPSTSASLLPEQALPTSPLPPTTHLHLRKDAEEVCIIALNTLILPLDPRTDPRQRHRTGGSRWPPAVSQTCIPRLPAQGCCSHHLAAICLERLGQGWQDSLRHWCRRGREGMAAPELLHAFRSFGQGTDASQFGSEQLPPILNALETTNGGQKLVLEVAVC